VVCFTNACIVGSRWTNYWKTPHNRSSDLHVAKVEQQNPHGVHWSVDDQS